MTGWVNEANGEMTWDELGQMSFAH